jgi:sRNA-binding carbon storage regulator CsrA|tara:strand:+ start:464 stop:646 length:183 start_codon:yes stop_codon:yes gene_type:complete
MLAITRKEGEKFFLRLSDGRKIVIFGRQHGTNSVRFLIDAPVDIKVLREELEEKIEARIE